eukprot:s1017_g8.t1
MTLLHVGKMPTQIRSAVLRCDQTLEWLVWGHVLQLTSLDNCVCNVICLQSGCLRKPQTKFSGLVLFTMCKGIGHIAQADCTAFGRGKTWRFLVVSGDWLVFTIKTYTGILHPNITRNREQQAALGTPWRVTRRAHELGRSGRSQSSFSRPACPK